MKLFLLGVSLVLASVHNVSQNVTSKILDEPILAHNSSFKNLSEPVVAHNASLRRMQVLNASQSVIDRATFEGMTKNLTDRISALVHNSTESMPSRVFFQNASNPELKDKAVFEQYLSQNLTGNVKALIQNVTDQPQSVTQITTQKTGSPQIVAGRMALSHQLGHVQNESDSLKQQNVTDSDIPKAVPYDVTRVSKLRCIRSARYMSDFEVAECKRLKLVKTNATLESKTDTDRVAPVQESNTTQGRKLLQAQFKVADKKVSSLKNYSEISGAIKNTAIYNHTEKFWEDVKKWALSADQLECKEVMQKWFDGVSVVQASGLPTSFSLLGNSTAVCKILKKTIIPKSLDWETDFVNDLASIAMGSLWISGQPADKDVKLPDQLEFVYHIQFDPTTYKIVHLEIVPMEPGMIFEAVASNPIKSFHYIVKTAMQEGLSSPKFLNLLSDKFVLEAPNLFLEKFGFKPQFDKTKLKEFVDQDVRIFDFENAKLAAFSIPFHDEKSVVAEIRFDQLPIKANGLQLEGLKFWLTHTFDCSMIDANATKVDIPSNQTEFKPQMIDKEPEKYCLLEKVQVTVNRPISLLSQLAPFDMEEDASK